MRVADRTDVAVSMATDNDGKAFGLDHLTGYSVTVDYDPATTGTFSLEMCNNPFIDDSLQNPNPDAAWVPITGSEITIASGTEDVAWNVEGAYYRAVRIHWEEDTGAGTYTAWWHAKGPQS